MAQIPGTQIKPNSIPANRADNPTAWRSALGLVIGTNVPSPTGTGASGNWGINAMGLASGAYGLSQSDGVWSLVGGLNVDGILFEGGNINGIHNVTADNFLGNATTATMAQTAGYATIAGSAEYAGIANEAGNLVVGVHSIARDGAGWVSTSPITAPGIVSNVANVFNVKQYGAVGNGTTDDYAAIKSAVAALSAAGTGTLYFPPGTYYIGRVKIESGPDANGVTDITFSGMSDFVVSGYGATIAVKGDFHRAADASATTSYTASVIPLRFTNCSRFRVEGLTLDGNVDQMTRDEGVGEGRCHGLTTSGCSDYTITDVYAHHFATDGIILGYGTTTADRNAALTNVRAEYNARQGLTVSQIRGAVLTNCRFSHQGRSTGTYGYHDVCAGVDIEPGKQPPEVDVRTGDITFLGCSFEDNQYIQFQAAQGPDYVEGVTLDGCRIIEPSDQVANEAVRLAVGNGLATRCYFEGREWRLSWTDADGSVTTMRDNVLHTNVRGVSITHALATAVIEGNQFIGTHTGAATSTIPYITGGSVAWRRNTVYIPTAAYTGTTSCVISTIANATVAEGNTYSTDHAAGGATYFASDYTGTALVRDERYVSGDAFRPAAGSAWDTTKPYAAGTATYPGGTIVGGTVVQPATASASAWRVNKTDGTPVINANTTNGYVGIGNAAATAPLDVTGVAKATGAHVWGTDPLLRFYGNAVNQAESGRIRFSESASNFQGFFLHLNGSANTFHIGSHETADNLAASDINAISIARSNGAATFAATITAPALKMTTGAGEAGVFPVADATGLLSYKGTGFTGAATGAAPIKQSDGSIAWALPPGGGTGGAVSVTGTPTVGAFAKFSGVDSITSAAPGVDYVPGTAGLATGLLKSTTGTGALSIATASDFPMLNQNTTGTAAGLSSGVYGLSLADGVWNVTGGLNLDGVLFDATNASGFHNVTADNFYGALTGDVTGTASGNLVASDLTPYAPLVSPALTGTPTAPTAALGTNTTQIATTAFVKAAVDAIPATEATATINAALDGGGSVIAPGQSVKVEVSGPATITEARLLGDVSGSLSVQVWRSTYAEWDGNPVDGGGTLLGTLTMSGAVKLTDSTLTGWTKTLADEDILTFVVTGTPSAVSNATIALKVTKS